jgi:thiamine transport system substrate-binding protein
MSGGQRVRAFGAVATALVLAGALGSCSDDVAEPVTLTLVTYDSFPDDAADTSLNSALDAFTAETGIGVKILVSGDAGTMASKAALSAGNPEGDVMWGIDNTLQSRVIDADVFEAFESTQLDHIIPELTALVPDHELTPVDFGDVCVNYDIAWFADHDLNPPQTLADLVDPVYQDLLVVEDPASSSTGLAFLLASVAEFGTDGWKIYWRDLAANGIEVVESWTSAYYERFSGSSGGGPRPLVVSYASSPVAEVVFADPPRTDAPTAVMDQTCFRQVEFAGILRGTDHGDEARQLLEFLVGPQLQAEVPLNLFVWPARTDVTLPQVFIDHSEVVTDPLTVPPAEIAANREAWIDEWTAIVLR